MLHDKFLIAICAILVVIVSVMAIFRPQHVPKVLSSPTSSQKIYTAPRIVEKKTPGIPPLRKEGQEGPFIVEKVLDGDTIRLDNGETVRLIGVDAPETKHPELPVQRFGEEATEFLRRMVEGFEITLEIEPGEERDKYGRLLAYVWLNDRMANAEIVGKGYAYAYSRFPFRRIDEFLALEKEARNRQYGLWHLSLRDGRITHLVKRYDSINLAGRRELDEYLDQLIKEYPYSPPDDKKKEEP